MKIVEGARAAVQFLNRPVVKEGVKNVAGSVSFAFGLVELYDLCQIARGRAVSTEEHSDDPKWLQVAEKVAIFAAKISLVLSAGVSHPGVFFLSTLFGPFIPMERLFGPNAAFCINPWHPRHMVSFAALALSLPSIALSAYRGIRWVSEDGKPWLTDAKVRLMALFNAITSRPVQHLGNQFFHWVLV